MNDLEFLLLRAIYTSPNKTQERKPLCEAGFSDVNTVADTLRELKEYKLIESPIGTDRLVLTKLGKKVYELEQKARQDAAKAERDNKFNKRIAIISLVISVLVAIETLVEKILFFINK